MSTKCQALLSHFTFIRTVRRRNVSPISQMRQLRFRTEKTLPGVSQLPDWQSQGESPDCPPQREGCYNRTLPYVGRWGGPICGAETLDVGVGDEGTLGLGREGQWLQQPASPLALSLPRHGWCGSASLSPLAHLDYLNGCWQARKFLLEF